jgi:amidophosphoribosyltransferase
MGRLGQTYFLSSESVALDSLNASLLRDVKPGELIEFVPESSEPICEQIMKPNPKFCAFEFNYGASRASVIEGKSVDEFRKEMGRKVFEFYRDQITKPGKVFPSPDSGRGVALGFAQASGFEYDEVVIKNPNAKRTFLIPNKDVREFEASVKFSVVKKAVEDQILYDGEDSTVRGTVAKQNAKALRRAGAKEIYLVLGSPPLTSTCPDYIHEGLKTFIASKYQGKDVKEIGRCVAKEIGFDGVFYPTLDMEVEALGIPKEHLCLACFTGKYPFEITS